MSGEIPFAEMIAGARNGNHEASEALCNQYYPIVKDTAAKLMSGGRFGESDDPLDIAQMVLLEFFSRIAKPDNSWRLDEPSQLRSLLIVMVRRELAEIAKRRRFIDHDGVGIVD